MRVAPGPDKLSRGLRRVGRTGGCERLFLTSPGSTPRWPAATPRSRRVWSRFAGRPAVGRVRGRGRCPVPGCAVGGRDSRGAGPVSLSAPPLKGARSAALPCASPASGHSPGCSAPPALRGPGAGGGGDPPSEQDRDSLKGVLPAHWEGVCSRGTSGTPITVRNAQTGLRVLLACPGTGMCRRLREGCGSGRSARPPARVRLDPPHGIAPGARPAWSACSIRPLASTASSCPIVGSGSASASLPPGGFGRGRSW